MVYSNTNISFVYQKLRGFLCFRSKSLKEITYKFTDFVHRQSLKYTSTDDLALPSITDSVVGQYRYTSVSAFPTSLHSPLWIDLSCFSANLHVTMPGSSFSPRQTPTIQITFNKLCENRYIMMAPPKSMLTAAKYLPYHARQFVLCYVGIGQINWSTYVPTASTFHLSKSKTFDRLTGPQCHTYNGQSTAVQCLHCRLQAYVLFPCYRVS